ncbi:tripartite tricarboxylate transporter substrate binding protein [Alkalihalobacillus oceani]|uniref:Tripartite tricarboxylate transporter substrate binding protein n=1 Tax=Halalkalibacter oceani TaxID=1653776 RepID=A0A9X2IMF0_9BACI|nr:tripartite tricarboxylate transporter substrate binding protein [Halalkalibacter oceani]MCM3713824.1 tripartite tricarboxylate transporter substrate binding protein [Halalkalibacter oceani]
MNVKKGLLVIIAILMLLVVAACGSNTENAESEGSGQQEGSGDQAASADNSYPEHEIEIIVPNAAGGSNDLVARSISQQLSEHLGVPVVIRNVESAGGSIARAQVFGEEPDGYTILTSPMPSMSIGELVNNDDFKVLEFEPVYQIFGNNSTVVAVSSDSEIETMEDLFNASKEKALTAAGTGAATNSTLASILLRESGLEHQYIPFEGDAGASTQVAGGHVDFGLISEAGAEALVRDNQVRIIGYLGEQRSEVYPDVPTMVELGYEDAYFEIVYGFFAPPGTPADIIEILESAFTKAVEEESFIEMGTNSGFIVSTRNAEEFGENIEYIHNRIAELQDMFEVD